MGEEWLGEGIRGQVEMTPRRTWGVGVESSASTPIMWEMDEIGGMTWSNLPGEVPAVLPERGTFALARTQQPLAGQGQRLMKPSASWALQLRKTISFATMEKVKKSGCQWVFRGAVGLCRMCQRNVHSVQIWLELYMFWASCCALLKNKVTPFPTTSQPPCFHPISPPSPKTSVTSSDHQQNKAKTSYFLVWHLKLKIHQTRLEFPASTFYLCCVLCCFLNTGSSAIQVIFQAELRCYLFQEAFSGITSQRASLSSEN